MRARRAKRRPGRRCFPCTASPGPGTPDSTIQAAQPRGHARYSTASASSTSRPVAATAGNAGHIHEDQFVRQMMRQDGGALRPDSTKCACRVLFRLVRGCRTNLDSCIFMRQSIEAAYLTRAFVTRTHEYAFRKGSCDSLVIGLTVLSNVEKHEVEMGVEAEPQKLFGLRELVRNRATGEPMARFNGTSPEMAQLYRFLLDNSVFVNLHWNQVMTNPRAVTG